MGRESTLGLSVPVFTVSLILGECEQSASHSICISIPSYQVPKFQVNPRTPSSTTVRPPYPPLMPGAWQKRSRRGTLFTYWNYIAACTGMGTIIAIASSGR